MSSRVRTPQELLQRIQPTTHIFYFSAARHGCILTAPLERGHSCPQVAPNARRLCPCRGALHTRTPLRTGMSALRLRWKCPEAPARQALGRGRNRAAALVGGRTKDLASATPPKSKMKRSWRFAWLKKVTFVRPVCRRHGVRRRTLPRKSPKLNLL